MSRTTKTLSVRQDRIWLGPSAVAVLAVLASVATLQPGLTGPGVTCDEFYHVVTGKQSVITLRHAGIGYFLHAKNWRDPEKRGDEPPVHPPLGSWILGGVHHVFDVDPDDIRSLSIAGARFAPALAMGLLALLVGLAVANRDGGLAGTVSAAAVVLVPRVFAHGHLAALDMLTTFFFVTAVLAVSEADARGGRPWQFALAGVVWGLTMLVRLHGVLLLPPIAAWMVWRFRRRVIGPLAAWGAAGGLTFFLGWPWLWADPVGRLLTFLATGTQRQTIHVFYWGQVWADRAVPWHYPVVMFLVTVPVGLLVLGLLGLWSKRRSLRSDGNAALAAAGLLVSLATFAWPGTPVYDGVRLFLMAFPLWAIFVGIGAKRLVDWPGAWWQRRPRKLRVAVVATLVFCQGFGIVAYHPCQLSHYNLLVGGLPGAERLGFEICYWGDAVVEPILAEAERHRAGGGILLVPALAPFHAIGIRMSSPSLADNRVDLRTSVSISAEDPTAPRCVVVYRRRADIPATPELVWKGKILAEYQKQGVWLSRAIQLPIVSPTRPPRRNAAAD